MNKLQIFMFVLVLIILIFSACGSTYDSDDGKCDICGATATYELNDEEYCNEHLGDAAAWYLNQ